MKNLAIAASVVMTLWLALFIYVMLGLRDPDGLSNPEVPARKSRTLFSFLGGILSALDDALARVTTFIKDVVAQLTNAKETNDTQTGKLAELQAALDVALSDDAEDKAKIAALQAEIAGLQDSVAAQINAAVDALQNVPVTSDTNADSADVPVDGGEEAPVE